MASKVRYVDVLRPTISVQEGSAAVLFEDVLRFMENREYRIGEKSFKFTLFDNPVNQQYVEGLVITTQDSDIPPKRNKQTGEFSSVDIDTSVEGFAYANVFLYDTRHKVFLYEINKNGCFPRQFIEAIYSFWNASTGEEDDNPRTRFNLSFPIFARRNEYDRMLRMTYYKKICIELVNPQGLVTNLLEETDSMGNYIKTYINNAAQLNANVIRIEQTALSKKYNPAGLSHDIVREMVDKVKSLFGRANIQTLEVQGYTEDAEEPRRCKPVDLLTDSFNESFKLEDIQVHRDLQSDSRKTGVESIYNRIFPEIQQILGSNNAE